MLVAWTGFSGYFAYGYIEKYIGLRKMQSEAERLSAETQRELERLMNIESKLQDQRKLLVTEGVCAANDLGAATEAAAASEIPAADQGPHDGGQAAPPPAAEADNNAPAALPAETPHPAKITNLAARALDSARGHISFDLTNQDDQLILNGRVSLAVITNTGRTAEVTQADQRALSFRIRRYKQINTNFAMPSGISMDDVAFVEVRLKGDNVPPYSERVPLNNA